MIKYYRLFDYLNRKGMKKTDLLLIISSPTLAKLSKNQVVKTDIIERICNFLDCEVEDIMENQKEPIYKNLMSEKIVDELYEEFELVHDYKITKTIFKILLRRNSKISNGEVEIDVDGLRKDIIKRVSNEV